MNVGVAHVLVAKVFSVERVTFLQSGTISGITKWNNATTTVVGDGTCVRNVNYVQDRTDAARAPSIQSNLHPKKQLLIAAAVAAVAAVKVRSR